MSLPVHTVQNDSFIKDICVQQKNVKFFKNQVMKKMIKAQYTINHKKH